MPHTEPLPEPYLRLLAAQREVSPEERAETMKDEARERLAHRIRRRLPKVY